jgi:hypothetical protein
LTATAQTSVQTTLDRAVDHLLSLQSAEGWWKGELETNVTMDAEDLLLRQFLGIRTDEQTEMSAKWIRSNVPGIHIPDSVIARLEGAQDQKKEGKQLCTDIINEVKEIPGVSGIHVMAYRQEEYVAEIVDESGVLKGRQPWKREIRHDDQMVADRLESILHDDITETQVDMVKTAH